jgi:hypothetical protein
LCVSHNRNDELAKDDRKWLVEGRRRGKICGNQRIALLGCGNSSSIDVGSEQLQLRETGGKFGCNSAYVKGEQGKGV